MRRVLPAPVQTVSSAEGPHVYHQGKRAEREQSGVSAVRSGEQETNLGNGREMRKISFADQLRYRFDNSMSKGPSAMIGWLFLVSLLMIVLVSVFVELTHQVPLEENHKPIPFGGLLWWNLMRALDSGA